MSLLKEVRKTLKILVYGFYDLKKIHKQLSDPQLSKTYFPEAERKNKLTIWKDFLLWQLKHHEVNRLYFVYGLDRKESRASEIIPYRKFNKIRDKKNQQLPLDFNYQDEHYNYVCLLRDKFIFAQLLKSLQFPTPQNIALFNKKEITWLHNMQTAPLATLVQEKTIQIDGFAKKLSGIVGTGAFTLRINDGKLYSKEKELSLEELTSKLDGQYLLQDKIIQHPKMAKLHPSSVNTIRLVTINNSGKVQPFTGALRIGANGKNVDNWAAGGIVISIDLETGKLKGEGLFKPGYGGRVEVHPNSGIVLEGCEIPYFKEGVDMACRLHSYLYHIHSIGWDIGITPEGPIFVEGNDDWDGGIPMALETNFKSRFLKMCQNGQP